MAGRARHADQTLWMQEREEEGERGSASSVLWRPRQAPPQREGGGEALPVAHGLQVLQQRVTPSSLAACLLVRCARIVGVSGGGIGNMVGNLQAQGRCFGWYSRFSQW